MTTLTMNSPQTPSQHVIEKAAKTAQVKDARGRTLTLKRPTVLQQYDLIEALGDSAKNDVYVGMVLPLIFVTEVDGDPVFPPTNKIQVRSLIATLGEDGVNAAMAGVQEHFGGATAEGDQAAIKK